MPTPWFAWLIGVPVWTLTLWLVATALAAILSFWCYLPKRIPTYRPGPSRQDVSRSYERRQPRQQDKNFYSSKPWLTVRREKLTINPICEVCLKAGQYTAATDVHHVLERKDFPEHALDLDNLESLCKPCHGAKRRGQTKR